MKETRNLMGMPVTVEIRENVVSTADIESVFDYFTTVDDRFSTYKKGSEISRINRGEILEKDYSPEMKEVFSLSAITKKETNGFFNIQKSDGQIDPSGLVKGWAIKNAGGLLSRKGYKNFYVEAGGDVQVSSANDIWTVGIKNPFNQKEIVKVLKIKNEGVATSGTYIRGQHIYNPHDHNEIISDIVSLTVIASNVYEADRFATAAFAMGREGINFIESLEGFEGYVINDKGIATETSGFEKYI